MNFPLKLLIKFTRIFFSEVILMLVFIQLPRACCRLGVYPSPIEKVGEMGEVARNSSNFCHGTMEENIF